MLCINEFEIRWRKGKKLYLSNVSMNIKKHHYKYAII
jgi:hypothetical protein